MPLALVAVVSCLVSPVSAEATSKGFRTTKGAWFCSVDQAYSGDLTCWTPNDGFTVWMSTEGKPRKKYVRENRGFYPKGDATNTIRGLGFGQTFEYGGYRCVSRRKGLTCRNHADRGGGWVVTSVTSCTEPR